MNPGVFRQRICGYNVDSTLITFANYQAFQGILKSQAAFQTRNFALDLFQ